MAGGPCHGPAIQPLLISNFKFSWSVVLCLYIETEDGGNHDMGGVFKVVVEATVEEMEELLFFPVYVPCFFCYDSRIKSEVLLVPWFVNY